MARRKIEVGVDDFLNEIKTILTNNDSLVNRGGVLTYVITKEVAAYLVKTCDMFLASPPEDIVEVPKSEVDAMHAMTDTAQILSWVEKNFPKPVEEPVREEPAPVP